jgi:RNA polymerase sigma-70 factor (ECF subfamily)
MNSTPWSLLERLRRTPDEDAWARFVELYTPLLYHWARRLGLQEPDAADLVQEVFAAVVQDLAGFTRRAGKRFRGWLWTVTLNKLRERHRREAARPAAVDGGDLAWLGSPDGVEEMEEAEYRQYLVDRALQLMQAEFQPATWKACWEYVVAGRPAEAVAAELGLTVNAVYLAKSRVLRRLRRELDGLLD